MFYEQIEPCLFLKSFKFEVRMNLEYYSKDFLLYFSLSFFKEMFEKLYCNSLWVLVLYILYICCEPYSPQSKVYICADLLSACCMPKWV